MFVPYSPKNCWKTPSQSVSWVFILHTDLTLISWTACYLPWCRTFDFTPALSSIWSQTGRKHYLKTSSHRYFNRNHVFLALALQLAVQTFWLSCQTSCVCFQCPVDLLSKSSDFGVQVLCMRPQNLSGLFPKFLEFLSKSFGFSFWTLWISFPNPLEFLSRPFGFPFQPLWISFPNHWDFLSKPFGFHFHTLWISFPNLLDFRSKLFGFHFHTLWISFLNLLDFNITQLV